jgi:hypothetical protein
MKSKGLINQEIKRLENLKKTFDDEYNVAFTSGKINALIWVKDEEI